MIQLAEDINNLKQFLGAYYRENLERYARNHPGEGLFLRITAGKILLTFYDSFGKAPRSSREIREFALQSSQYNEIDSKRIGKNR